MGAVSQRSLRRTIDAAAAGAMQEASALDAAAKSIAEDAVILAARTDIVTFCEYVLRHELTKERVVLKPQHHAWHNAANAEKHLIIWSHIEGGKTTLLTVGRALFQMGRFPESRGAIASSTATAAQKIGTLLIEYIEESEELHKVFPNLRPSRRRNAPWNKGAFTVERSSRAKDPTCQCVGVNTSIMGSRFDWFIADDILDLKNTRTRAQIDAVTTWVKTTPLGRLSRDGWALFVGNVWDDNDTLHRLVADHGFAWVKTPAVDPDTAEELWPEVWSRERLAEALRILGPEEFARQILCRTRDNKAAVFKREYVQKAKDKGRGWTLVPRVEEIPAGCAIYTGVDLAVQDTPEHDLNVFCTVMRQSDGTRQILNIESGRMTGPEIVGRLEELHMRYGGIFVVENNAAQHFILQFARLLTRALVVPFTTGKQKADPHFGVEGLAVELDQGLWLFPCEGKMQLVDNELGGLITDALFYKRGAHTGDRLMAMWFAREGIRMLERRERATDRPAPQIGRTSHRTDDVLVPGMRQTRPGSSVSVDVTVTSTRNVGTKPNALAFAEHMAEAAKAAETDRTRGMRVFGKKR